MDTVETVLDWLDALFALVHEFVLMTWATTYFVVVDHWFLFFVAGVLVGTYAAMLELRN